MVSGVSPATVLAGATQQTVTVSGSSFVPGSAVLLNGNTLQTTFVSATTLQATVPAAALAAGAATFMTVTNPAPGGGTSAASGFTIMSPTPVIAALMPASVAQGAPAVVTVSGTGFEANSTVLWNGAARPTMFVSGTSLQVSLTAADVSSYGTGQITVNNPGPGGSATTPTELLVRGVQPVIGSLNPSSIPVTPNASGPATVTLNGSNFASAATVQASGSPLTITSQSSTQIVVSVPATFLYSTGTLNLVVTNPAAANESSPVSSAAAILSVINPSASFSVSPSSAPAGSGDTTITLYGQSFFKDSLVQWNGTALKTTYSGSNSLTAVVPSPLLAGLGVAKIGVVTPENLGQAPPTQPFSTYLPLPVNDIAWNAKDGLIYATVAGTAGPGLGNSLVGVDPNTGVIQKTIFVGSEPNRVAISDDGTQAFVGLDKAGSARQVNLQTATAGVQFLLGGGPGVYNPPFTAKALAAVPGEPNSVAVYASSGIVTIYDAGVPRAKTSSGLQTYFTSNYGGLAFGDSAGTLYVSSEAIGSYVYRLTVDATGITASKQLSTAGSGITLQYDKGRLYFPVGVVADATTGASLGQFSTSSTNSSTATAANGPIFSDSTLNLAWVLSTNFNSNSQILSFDETSFNPVGSLPISGLNGSFPAPADLIRWGQTGLAFHTGTQLYVVQGPIVKDTSASPTDLSITAQAGTTATTGTTLSYQFQVTNQGPNTAQGVTVSAALPGSVIFGGATSSQGSCAGSGTIYCDLGSITNGASATITLSGTPTVAGAIETTARVASQSYDPSEANNQASAATTVTGALFSAVPTVSQLSPNFVASGSSTLTLTVNGTGFDAASSVLWNGTALPTTLMNSGQLTATVDASLLKQIGSAQVAVSSAPPGGGQSGTLTLSVYGLLDVPANAIVYDPFTRQIYAALPSTAKSLTGTAS